jgi:hypothetical protein
MTSRKKFWQIKYDISDLLLSTEPLPFRLKCKTRIRHDISVWRPLFQVTSWETSGSRILQPSEYGRITFSSSAIILFKNPVRTSQETHYVSTAKRNWLMLFGETIAVYCENHTEHIYTLCEQSGIFLNVIAGGANSDRCGLEVLL